MSTSSLNKAFILPGIQRTRHPRLVYGTAWKKDRSANLVYLAIQSGFRGIDTAAQPRHYDEKLVGDGIRKALSDGLVKREDLYIQTKYTPPGGQDPQNMPYKAALPLEDQIHASVASSLKNLSTGVNSYLDSLVLHSPLPTLEQTLTALRTLAEYVPSQIHHLGVANISHSMLSAIVSSDLPVPISVVQNRFYPGSRYDGPVRKLCRDKGLVFQSFWTLTGNPELLRSQVVGRLAHGAGVTHEMALYALVMGLGNVSVLDGTTNQKHMTEDLDGLGRVGKWIEGDGQKLWQDTLEHFKSTVGE